MLPLKPFYMIRHGETEHNIANIAAGGETNSALTDKGRQQAKTLAPYLKYLNIQPGKIFHSSMQRARDTATYLNKELKLDMEEVHDLREQEIGDWAGFPWEEIYPKFRNQEEVPNGENAPQFTARVQRAMTYCIEASERLDGPPLIVAHGGLFYGLGYLYDIYDAITMVKNCQIHYFEPHTDHPYFPWKIIEFEPAGEALSSLSPPFCATKLPQKRPA
jgi:broad specificity phosphatase PhoE